MKQTYPPRLSTARLHLRPFNRDDASVVAALAGHRDIASTTLRIPHPYQEGMARAWIDSHEQLILQGKAIPLAIELSERGELIGAIGLEIAAIHERAEIGYWIGVPYWGKGYCTEAAQEIVRYGFEVLRLNRLVAHYFERNSASGRVIEKLGMRREGVLRRHVKKWGEFEDLVACGILREEYVASRNVS